VSPESNPIPDLDTSEVGFDVDQPRFHINVGDQTGASDIGVDFDGMTKSTDTVVSKRTDDDSISELGDLDVMQRRDSLQVHIWKHYSNTNEQLPNQDRIENLTWRMMAKN